MLQISFLERMYFGICMQIARFFEKKQKQSMLFKKYSISILFQLQNTEDQKYVYQASSQMPNMTTCIKETESEHTAVHPADNAIKSNLFTVSEIHAKMYSFAEKDLNAYCLKWMKKQLGQHYQNSIFLNHAVRRTRPSEDNLFYRYSKYHDMRVMVQK